MTRYRVGDDVSWLADRRENKWMPRALRGRIARIIDHMSIQVAWSDGSESIVPVSSPRLNSLSPDRTTFY